MIRITIVEPFGLDVNLTSADSPVWHDEQGREYRVASGLIDTPPEAAWWPIEGRLPALSTETAIVIAGMDGFAALNALGLSCLSHEQGL